jgi:hypothetical protein
MKNKKRALTAADMPFWETAILILHYIKVNQYIDFIKG